MRYGIDPTKLPSLFVRETAIVWGLWESDLHCSARGAHFPSVLIPSAGLFFGFYGARISLHWFVGVLLIRIGYYIGGIRALRVSHNIIRDVNLSAVSLIFHCGWAWQLLCRLAGNPCVFWDYCHLIIDWLVRTAREVRGNSLSGRLHHVRPVGWLQ